MLGYEMGASAFTTASHAALILAVILVFSELMLARRVSWRDRPIAEQTHVRLTLIAVFAAVVVERLYYVVARLLKPNGIDLWQMHPVPELLSGAVAVAVYGFGFALIMATAVTRRAGVIAAVANGASIALMWAAIAVILY